MTKKTILKLRDLGFAVIESRRLLKKYLKLTHEERKLLGSCQNKISQIAKTLSEKDLVE
jgi:hypothetical protein